MRTATKRVRDETSAREYVDGVKNIDNIVQQLLTTVHARRSLDRSLGDHIVGLAFN